MIRYNQKLTIVSGNIVPTILLLAAIHVISLLHIIVGSDVNNFWKWTTHPSASVTLSLHWKISSSILRILLLCSAGQLFADFSAGWRHLVPYRKFSTHLNKRMDIKQFWKVIAYFYLKYNILAWLQVATCRALSEQNINAHFETNKLASLEATLVRNCAIQQPV